MRRMSFRDRLQSSNSSESSESVHGFSSSASCSAPIVQHLLQVGLRANENMLMLTIWELTTRNKSGCVLIL